MRTEGYPGLTLSNTSGAFTWSTNQTTTPFFQGAALGGLFSGFPYASLLLGTPDTVQISQPTNTRGGRGFYSWFAQDAWKLTRKFTLDYGLRYDYVPPQYEVNNHLTSFQPNIATNLPADQLVVPGQDLDGHAMPMKGLDCRS